MLMLACLQSRILRTNFNPLIWQYSNLRRTITKPKRAQKVYIIFSYLQKVTLQAVGRKNPPKI